MAEESLPVTDDVLLPLINPPSFNWGGFLNLTLVVVF